MSIIKQIATECGVSTATVGHILGNKRNMHSEETCSRVLLHAEKLGYRPNSSAMAIGSGRFNCATLLLSTYTTKSNLQDQKLLGIHEVLDSHDYHLNIARMTDERMAFNVSLPKFLRQWMTDGILVNYTSEISERVLEGIRGDRAPAVWINSKQEWDCVRPDDFLAGYEATIHLLKLGHSRILFTEFGGPHYSVDDRYQGYASAMESAGLTPRLERHALDVQEWIGIAHRILEAPDRPTAVVAYAEFPGKAIAHVAERLGLRVPEDLSLVMFADLPVEDLTTGRRFTSWLVPEYEVGETAAHMLLKKIAMPEKSFAPITVPFVMSDDVSCSRLAGAPAR